MTLAAIDTAVRQGKGPVFQGGTSNHSASQLCEMLWLADRHARPPVVSSQIPLNLLRREFHHDLTFCRQHGIGVTPYQSLQQGLLTGKYRRAPASPGRSRAAEKPGGCGRRTTRLLQPPGRHRTTRRRSRCLDDTVRPLVGAGPAGDQLADRGSEAPRPAPRRRVRRRCPSLPRAPPKARLPLPTPLASTRPDPRLAAAASIV